MRVNLAQSSFSSSSSFSHLKVLWKIASGLFFFFLSPSSCGANKDVNRGGFLLWKMTQIGRNACLPLQRKKSCETEVCVCVVGYCKWELFSWLELLNPSCTILSIKRWRKGHGEREKKNAQTKKTHLSLSFARTMFVCCKLREEFVGLFAHTRFRKKKLLRTIVFFFAIDSNKLPNQHTKIYV